MLYIIVAYLICGIATAMKDLQASPINAPIWTLKPSFKMLALVVLTWFFYPIMSSFSKDPLRNRQIAFGLFGTITQLAFVSLLVWISFRLAGQVTDSFIIHLIISMVLLGILLLFVAPLLTIPMMFVTLILSWPLNLLFPLPDKSKDLKWCRNCQNFKKSKEYENTLWRAGTIPTSEKLPCQITLQTAEVWKAYFCLENGKRSLFPKDCSFFLRKT